MQNHRTPQVSHPDPTPAMAEGIKNGLLDYIKVMETMGYIITIERQPVYPLAMGNSHPVVEVRVTKEFYRKPKAE